MTDEERNRKKEKVSKWDEIRRSQLGVALTLIFGLASGGLAFCSSLLTAEKPPFTAIGAGYFRTAFILFVITVGVSVAATITRLTDFRLTALKLRSELRESCACYIKLLGTATRFLGHATWILFYAQIILFACSVYYLAMFLWHTFHARLFP